METPNRNFALVNRGYLNYVIDTAVDDLIASMSLISMGHTLLYTLNKINPNSSNDTNIIRPICSIGMIISFLGPLYILNSRYRKSGYQFDAFDEDEEEQEQEENKEEKDD